MPTILLYGGTFNPIHVGHLITCRRARELLAADRVLLIPARTSPHKLNHAQLATPEQRVAMLQLAIENEPHFAIDDRELHREGPSYTIDTIRSLKKERPTDTFKLLIGTDQLPQLHTWREAPALLDEIDIAPLPRPGTDIESALATLAQTLGTSAAERLRKNLLPTPQLEIASSEIRTRITQNLPITFLVPPKVADYIAANRLYK